MYDPRPLNEYGCISRLLMSYDHSSVCTEGSEGRERIQGREDNEMIGAGHSQCVSGSNNTFWVSCLPPVHRIFFVSSKLFLLIPHILCLVFENAYISSFDPISTRPPTSSGVLMGTKWYLCSLIILGCLMCIVFL